jgi:hypothetical protein
VVLGEAFGKVDDRQTADGDFRIRRIRRRRHSHLTTKPWLIKKASYSVFEISQ